MEESRPSFEERIQALEEEIIKDYAHGRVIDRMELYAQPDRSVIEDLIAKFFQLIYPGYYRDHTYRVYNLKNSLCNLVEDIAFHLNRQIAIALRGNLEGGQGKDMIEQKSEAITAEFFNHLPEIRAFADTDLQAAFDGDPAATNKEEIIIAYPGLFAITVNRIAHVLYELKVPLIPRIMTEYAHSRTGIDIHPGAKIGKYFFIDHGTGIVVGETTEIGEAVKIYQGVTLGALSTRGGQKLRGTKRHPTIEDNVTIYAGASILGGDTVIGHDTIIGSNAFITSSIAPGTRVTIKNQELQYKGGKGYVEKETGSDQTPPWFYVI